MKDIINWVIKISLLILAEQILQEIDKLVSEDKAKAQNTTESRKASDKLQPLKPIEDFAGHPHNPRLPPLKRVETLISGGFGFGPSR